MRPIGHLTPAYGLRRSHLRPTRCFWALAHGCVFLRPSLLAFVVASRCQLQNLSPPRASQYNQNKGFDPSKVVTEYHRTLHEVRKTLEQQLNADTMLLWLGLPPATNKHFGHDKFPLFDRQASDMLYAASLPLAFFFNTSAGTRARAEADPNLFYDGLHWCNWGATTVPEFLIDRLVHVLLNRESFHTAFRSPMARSGSALASTSPHALLVPSPPPAISSVEPAAAASSPFSEQLPAGIADGALVADVVAAFFSSSPLPPLNLSACVFMRGRDEARYLQEWLVYHRLIGFQHFYLYDTDSSAESSSALRPLVDLGLVTIVDWSKSGSHGAQLEDCFMRSDRPTRWMSDWDIDEFLFVDGLQPSAAALRGSAQFPLHLLVRYMETRRMGALVLHRKNYGSNGHATPPNDLVMSAYTMSLPFSSAGEPCITDPGKILQFLPAQHRRPDHSAVNKPGWRIVNANLRNFTPWLADAREVADAPADNCVPPHMHLKHYFSRSVEECIFKQNISNGDSGGTWRAARGPSWCYEIDVSDTTQPAETGFFSAYRDNSLAITLFPAVVRAIIAQF